MYSLRLIQFSVLFYHSFLTSYRDGLVMPWNFKQSYSESICQQIQRFINKLRSAAEDMTVIEQMSDKPRKYNRISLQSETIHCCD